jgi:hypothetical protein
MKSVGAIQDEAFRWALLFSALRAWITAISRPRLPKTAAKLGDLPARLGLLILAVSSLISDFPKNILVPTHPKSLLELSHPTPPEGRIAIVTDAGWGAVDAAASGAQRDAGRVGERPVSDQTAS